MDDIILTKTSNPPRKGSYKYRTQKFKHTWEYYDKKCNSCCSKWNVNKKYNNGYHCGYYTKIEHQIKTEINNENINIIRLYNIIKKILTDNTFSHYNLNIFDKNNNNLL
jgi:hypothetical protein